LWWRATGDLWTAIMMENPYKAGTTEIRPGAAENERPRTGALGAAGRGAKKGARVLAWVSGLLSSVMVVPALAVTAFGLGSGRGLGVSSYVPAGIGVFLFFTALGGMIGGTGALVGALVSGSRPGKSGALELSTDEPVPAAGAARAPSEFAKGKRWRRRWPWFIAASVTLLLATAFIIGTYVGRNVDRRLAAAIAAADRDDPNWRLDDLLAHREEVPDALNSAPVMDEVLARVPEGWPNTRDRVSGVAGSVAERIKDAFDESGRIPSNVKLSDSVVKALRVELKTYEKAVGFARSLAKYPRGRHELSIGRAVIDTLLPHTEGARTAARLLVADAVLRAQDGDIDGALESCRAIFAAARSIGDEPFLISHLVRASIGEVALNSMGRVLGQGEGSDAALARLQELMLDEMGQPLLLIGVKGERAVLTEVIRRLGAGEVPITALSGSRASDRAGPPGAIAPWGKLWFDQQEAVALERMTVAVAIARKPFDQQPALWRVWEAEAKRVKDSPLGRYTGMLPLLLAPAVAAASPAFSRYRTDLAANAILVAAERHRRKTGRWPATVAAIDRSILTDAPVDPFTGESFRMEHRDGEIVIYSIGPNRQDEHGAYEPKRWMRGGPDDAGGRAWDISRRGRPAPREVETDE
jgi:hypothetical protein